MGCHRCRALVLGRIIHQAAVASSLGLRLSSGARWCAQGPCGRERLCQQVRV